MYESKQEMFYFWVEEEKENESAWLKSRLLWYNWYSVQNLKIKHTIGVCIVCVCVWNYEGFSLILSHHSGSNTAIWGVRIQDIEKLK